MNILCLKKQVRIVALIYQYEKIAMHMSIVVIFYDSNIKNGIYEGCSKSNVTDAVKS